MPKFSQFEFDPLILHNWGKKTLKSCENSILENSLRTGHKIYQTLHFANPMSFCHGPKLSSAKGFSETLSGKDKMANKFSVKSLQQCYSCFDFTNFRYSNPLSLRESVMLLI